MSYTDINTIIAEGKIANALKSTAADHVVAKAENIYDTALKGYQSEINDNFTNKFNNYLLLAGGTLTGDLTLKTNTSGAPSIIFQRGETNDSFEDWKITDIGGYFKIQNRNSENTWIDVLSLAPSTTKTLTSSYGVLPSATNTLSLGNSTYKWSNVYATNFNGALKGNADTATLATKSTNIAGGVKGSIPYQSAANTTAMLGIGSEGQVLKVSSTGLPVWSSDNNTDTKNTAGSTNSASKLFLIGATSQDANPQTYSNSKIYATDGVLTATEFDGPLTGAWLTDVNLGYSDKHLKFYSTIQGCTATEETGNKRYAGTANSYGFPVSNNANSMLWLGAHPGNYGHQLGFSSNGNIYMRYISSGSFPEIANGGSWKALVTTTGSDPVFVAATTSEIQALFS